MKKKAFPLLVLSLLITMSTNVFAAQKDENIKTNEQSFYSKQEIMAQWEKVKNKPVKTDKTAATSQNGIIAAAAYGTYPTRTGVILVTADAYKGLIPLGHSAMVRTSTTVVESVASGVVIGPNNWSTTKNTCYGVTTYRTTTTQDAEASNYCYSQLGKPYNYNYFNPYTRTKFYCSQLIYASYLDLFGIDLNTDDFGVAIHPMELVNTPETYIIYEK